MEDLLPLFKMHSQHLLIITSAISHYNQIEYIVLRIRMSVGMCMAIRPQNADSREGGDDVHYTQPKQAVALLRGATVLQI